MNTERPALRLDTSLEWLSERLATIQAPAVVATVISASGSTYRKPGARMLLEADERITGLLSGGCFERDLRENAGCGAEPLVAGFRALRYPVTVVDHMPAYANATNFPGAAVVARRRPFVGCMG
jgi:xanthine/CO dehydrogenase XdhC/CoxF family maturation factor